ncbi:MAG: QueT transporter family protein [Clostridiales bacterium]|nr:QueT transporter family protein [Clostridiales bacterium]
MKNFTIRRLAITGVIAALYVVLTLSLSFMSFESIQFRVSEILNLMAFIDPLYGVGVIIGCLISNLFSPLGPIDMIVGTLATALAVFAISRTKKLFIASLWPMVANVLVGIELTYIFRTPLWYNIITVWIGEFVVVCCLGYPLFKLLLQNQRVLSILRPLRENTENLPTNIL